jgi:hypothetical protein
VEKLDLGVYEARLRNYEIELRAITDTFKGKVAEAEAAARIAVAMADAQMRSAAMTHAAQLTAMTAQAQISAATAAASIGVYSHNTSFSTRTNSNLIQEQSMRATSVGQSQHLNYGGGYSISYG